MNCPLWRCTLTGYDWHNPSPELVYDFFVEADMASFFSDATFAIELSRTEQVRKFENGALTDAALRVRIRNVGALKCGYKLWVAWF